MIVSADGSEKQAAQLAWKPWLPAVARLMAAALIGFGLILWIAANWDHFGRFGRFAIVASGLALAVAASFHARLRQPALLAAFLAAGGLLALIGQTYQTGADPWQLFAWWALLTLPWALAARHDAVWAGWGVVVMTAITLWLATFARGLWSPAALSVTLSAWGLALGISAALSPWSRLAPWIGATRWAFHIVALLAVALIGQGALTALFGGQHIDRLYFVGTLLLAGIVGLLAASTPLDLLVLSVTSLALDTLLICGITRALFTSASDTVGSTLLVGLAAAGIVAGTGALLLKLVRWRQAEVPGRELLAQSTWPVTLLSGVGALLAAIPLLSFLSAFLGLFLTVGVGAYLLGIAGLIGAVRVLRRADPTSFVHQLAVIGCAVAFALLAYGLYRDTGRQHWLASTALALTAAGLAFAVGRSWVASLLGAVAAGFTAVVLQQAWNAAWLPRGPTVPDFPSDMVWSLLLAAASAWVLKAGSANRPDGERAPTFSTADPLFVGNIDRVVGGATGLALLGLVMAAGPAFLVGASVGWRGPSPEGAVYQPLWRTLSPLSALLATAGVGLLLASRPALATGLGYGSAIVTVVLAAVVPGLGAAVLLAIAAGLAGRQTLTVAAIATAFWMLGSFYYWLGWPLAHKAALLVAAGALLAVLCWTARWTAPVLPQGLGPAAPARLATALVAVGALAVAGGAAHSIWRMEQVLTAGRAVYLPLAPVDPRSLMQGDYMALNFALPNSELARTPPTPGAALWAVASLDEKRVATIARLVRERPAAVGSGEVLLHLKAKNGRWIVTTDAWYFKEGTGAKWAAARFGEFRVTADGQALLVNLADKDLATLR